MPLSIEDMMLPADESHKKGNHAEALQYIDKYCVEFMRTFDAATPYEVMTAIAGIARQYQSIGEWEFAALKFADVCAYAHKNEPGTTETAGDFYNLSNMLYNIKDYPNALTALERSIDHLKKAGVWEAYETTYVKLHNELKKKL